MIPSKCRKTAPPPKTRVRNDLYYQLPISTKLLYDEVLKIFHKISVYILVFFIFVVALVVFCNCYKNRGKFSLKKYKSIFNIYSSEMKRKILFIIAATMLLSGCKKYIDYSAMKFEDYFYVNGVSFEMVYVEGGSFDMGATTEQGSDAENDEKPVHRVTLSGYYIGRCEVTQELWEAVMGSNPSYFNGAQNPVENVSWNDCQEFISMLNSLTGRTFRLPTEAEWEYAARGGNQSRHYKYSGSNNIFDVAWHDGDSGDKTHAVGTKTANELGIYDMSGNVIEWCSDWYGDYRRRAQTNPQGPSSGSARVLRGGSWGGDARSCRVSFRNYGGPGGSFHAIGLRLVLVP